MAQEHDWSSVGSPVEANSHDWSSVGDAVDASGKPKEIGGFKAAAKQTIGHSIKGIGQLASDYVGADQDNAVKRYGQSVVDANPTSVHGFGDIVDKPLTTIKEAVGNAAGSMAGIVGSGALGRGIAMIPHPVAKAVGAGIAAAGPIIAGALPSYSGIREAQINDNSGNESDATSKALALAGAGTVGLIESKFGPQEWALSAMTKAGRDKLAQKFGESFAKSVPGAIGKGALRGGAIEGAEELVQNPVEQLASYQNPTTAESLKDTAFGGVMGAIGGGVLGGGMAPIGMKYAESKRQPVAEQPAADQPAIAGLLPAPTYTGTPGDQIISNDAERQAVIDAADANAAAVYAARDAFEKQLRQSVTIINEPAPLQQRIDDMLGVDTSSMGKAERADYEKSLAAAFSEPIGIRHDANQREVPFTIGEYLDAQIAAENAAMARPLKQNAAQQSDARLQQVADEESTGYVAPEIPVVGTLSAAANIAVQSGAHAATVANQQQASEGFKTGQTWRKGNQSYTIESVSPDGKAGKANFGKGESFAVHFDTEKANGWSAEQNSQAEAISTKPGKADTPTTGNREAAPQLGILAGIAAQAPSIAQSAPNTQPQGQGGMPATAQQVVPAATSPAGVEFDVSKRTNQQLEYLSQNGQPGWREAATAEIQRRGVQISQAQQSNTDAIAPSAMVNPDAPAANSASVPALKASDSAKAPEIQNGDGVTNLPTEKRGIKTIDRWSAEELQGRLDRGNLSPESEQRLRAELAKRQPVKQSAPQASPLTVGKTPNGAEPVTVRNGVVHVGDYPAIDYETEADITVPEGATPQQIADALRNGGALGSRKIFGLKADEQKPQEKPAVEDTIGWTRMTTVEREALVAKAGWTGKTRGINLGGAIVAKQAWGKMSEANRAKLVAASQIAVKKENPSAATVAEETAAPDQAPIKKDEQPKNASDRLRSGEINVEQFMEATGLTDDDVGTFSSNGARNKADAQAKKESRYHAGIEKISAAIFEAERGLTQGSTAQSRRAYQANVAKYRQAQETLGVIAKHYEHPFKNTLLSKLPPFLESRFGKQWDGIEYGDSAKRAFHGDSYRKWVDLLIGAADNKNGTPISPAVSQPKTDTAPEAKQEAAPVSTPQPDAALQNRDRGRAASVNQMQSIARNPDYMRLGPSRTPDSGAPMVFAVGGDTNKISPASMGGADIAVMADGQRVPFRYAVVDARSVEPSNFADGATNPAFSSDTPGTIKALNNGRTASVRAAHEGNTAANYAAELLVD